VVCFLDAGTGDTWWFVLSDARGVVKQTDLFGSLSDAQAISVSGIAMRHPYSTTGHRKARDHRGKCNIGTSGYQYNHWSGVFYPEKLPKRRWFEHYSAHFNTVEINNTFYGLPKPETFDTWRQRAPEGFCYTLKFSRYGSHLKRLKDPAQSIGTFLDRARRLEAMLGPILLQLPPHWDVDPERLGEFLKHAPKDLRWAVEFRDPSWLCEEIYQLLRNHNAALCIHDIITDHPHVVTADWVYLRFHGTGRTGKYARRQLAASSGEIKAYLTEGLDVYAYFNNDVGGYAVSNAATLEQLVSSSLC